MRKRDGSAAACHLARVLSLALTNLDAGRVVSMARISRTKIGCPIPVMTGLVPVTPVDQGNRVNEVCRVSRAFENLSGRRTTVG